jgi:hypothetical protein
MHPYFILYRSLQKFTVDEIEAYLSLEVTASLTRLLLIRLSLSLGKGKELD